MKIARILYPVKNLGPGNRLGIWMSGCNRACKGCANPELWNSEGVGDISIEVVKSTISYLKNGDYPVVDGITISGGEPFLQPDDLECLVDFLVKEGLEDILIFTGFKKEEIQKKYGRILKKTAVLVDGSYEEDLNDGHPLRGSSNQNIYYLKEKYRQLYEDYIAGKMGKHHVQLFSLKDGKVAAGIHKKHFAEEYKHRIQVKMGDSNGTYISESICDKMA